jgi:hypothetical protein
MKPILAVPCLAAPLCVRNVSDWSLGPKIICPEWRLLWLSSVSPGKCPDITRNYITTASVQIFWTYFSLIVLLFDTIWATDTYLRTELSPSWEAANCAATQKISSNFKEPEGSSPCSQEPSTGPYTKPVRSSPHHPILSL